MEKKYAKIVAASFAKVGTQTVDRSLKEKCEHAQSIVRLKKYFENGNTLFICGVREFVGRNMSYFFQTISDKTHNDVKHKGNDYKGELCFLGEQQAVQKMDIDFLIDTFYKRKWIHETPVVWFEEFFETVGFNYKTEAFNKEKGYQFYNLKNNNNLLLYRLDDIVAMIKNVDIFKNKVISTNIGAKKWYKSQYKNFKDEISFSDEYLEKQLNNDVMKFFYLDKEKDTFIKKYRVGGKI